MSLRLETETFTRCGACRKRIQVISPRTKKQYESGLIKIDGGTVLLPERVALANSKPGHCQSHASDLSGYYCNHECLSRRIRELLHLIGATVEGPHAIASASAHPTDSHT
jgi:hypothetical protein